MSDMLMFIFRVHVHCIKKKKFRCVRLISKYVRYVCMYVCMVTACARRVVTELVSERFPAIQFHSLSAIAAIIVSYVYIFMSMRK